MPLTLISWNLKGSKGVDVRGVVDHVEAAAADLVLLQEVQWAQARAIARELGAASQRWAFKHWPVRTWPEGMAVIGRSQPAPARTRVLTKPWSLWSWRRRICQVASVDVHDPSGTGTGTGTSTGPATITVVNVHLSAGDAAVRRQVEADVVLRLIGQAGRPAAVVAGDLNERPGGAALQRFAAAGLRDVWSVLRGDGQGPTNWRGWVAATAAPPTQRLDYVLVTARLDPVAVSVPVYGDPGFQAFASLSDHLPVTATVAAHPAP